MAKEFVMIKNKIFCFFAVILTVAFVFSACAKEASTPKSTTAEPLQMLQGIVTDASMNTLDVQGDEDILYSFLTEGIEVDTSNFPYVVGAGVEIYYQGELDNAQSVQGVTVTKIVVIHAPLVEEKIETTTQPETTTEPQITEVEPTTQVSSPVPEGNTANIMASMTLEEKVAQMFIVRCPVQNATAIAQAQQFGGYILFGRDFKDHTKDSIRATIAEYQSVSKVPMLIGVDEEGGTVVRISSNKNFRAVQFWSPQALFREGGFDLVANDTKEKSILLKSLGVNLNFAPVCDVSTDPSDFIFKRSFGHAADLTSQYVTTVVNEMNAVGIGSVLKHFPGYGNNADTHTAIAVDEREYDNFSNSDFLPFQAGIATGAGSVLVSHNIVKSMDPEAPASLSPNVHRILREDLGFSGVIVTDDLAMGAIKQYLSDASAAVTAVNAGNDLLICTNFEEQMPSVVNAVRNGEISEQRVNESVTRILNWKTGMGLI